MSDSIVPRPPLAPRPPWLLAGVGLVAIALVSLFAQADFWPNSGFAWTLLLLGGLVIVFAQRRTNDGTRAVDTATTTATPAKRPRQPSLLLPGLGVLLAAAGALALAEAVGVDVRWDVALAVGAIGTGVAVVAGVALRRRTGGLVVVGFVLAALAVAVSAVDVRLGPDRHQGLLAVRGGDLKRNYAPVGDQTRPATRPCRRRHEVDAIGIGEQGDRPA